MFSSIIRASALCPTPASAIANPSSPRGYRSVGDRLAETNNRPSGFDYLRLVLALSVICFHTVIAGYGAEVQREYFTGPARPLILLMLPIFFALSGFLVASSLERSKTIFTFLGLRALRIVPALTADTIFAALILGPIFTGLSLQAYFSDHRFYAYFLNIIGDIHYYLPGVFLNNPVRDVNTQLWTIPFELKCYAVLATLGVFRIHVHKRLFISAVTFYLAWKIGKSYYRGDVFPIWPDPLLVPSFLVGVCAYLFRDYIPYNGRLAILALATSFALLYIRSEFAILASIPMTYLTVYIGLTNPKKIAIIKTGDYSYGLYLYGFPLQQALIAAIPAAKTWYINILLGVPLCFVFAVCSWHFCEKPALSWRRYLYPIEAWCGAILGELQGRLRLKLRRQAERAR
jgi:peptidoglycan/LPS O-acetylase OafA/YrhL